MSRPVLTGPHIANPFRQTLQSCLLALCCLAICAASPPDQLTRQIWRVQDGLPEDIVQAAVQDAQGFLWVGTTGGLLQLRDGAANGVAAED